MAVRHPLASTSTHRGAFFVKIKMEILTFLWILWFIFSYPCTNGMGLPSKKARLAKEKRQNSPYGFGATTGGGGNSPDEIVEFENVFHVDDDDDDDGGGEDIEVGISIPDEDEEEAVGDLDQLWDDEEIPWLQWNSEIDEHWATNKRKFDGKSKSTFYRHKTAQAALDESARSCVKITTLFRAKDGTGTLAKAKDGSCGMNVFEEVYGDEIFFDGEKCRVVREHTVFTRRW
jgi:hypothetical protein